MGKIDNEFYILKDQRKITLRSPNEEDAEGLIAFMKGVLQENLYVITRADEFNYDSDKKKEFIKGLNEDQGKLGIIAEFDGRIVGFLDFGSRGNRARIRHRGEFGITLHADFRGFGLGRRMIERLIAWAKREDNPIEKITLGVLSINQPARQLYRSLGFEDEGFLRRSLRLDDGSYADEIRQALFVG